MMKKRFEQIKKIDLEKVFEMKDSKKYKRYDFYVKYHFYTMFISVLLREIKYEVYREVEHKKVNFMKLLIVENGFDNMRGYINSNRKKLRSDWTAKCCRRHYKKMLMLGKRKMLCKTVRFDKEDIPTVLMMGIRGIADVVFIMEKLDLIVYITNVGGVVIFNEDNRNIKHVAEMARQSGLEFYDRDNYNLDDYYDF